MTAQGVGKSVSLDGIKLSSELIWVQLEGLTVETGSPLHFFRQLSRDRINLPFITTRCSAGRMDLSCCAAAEDGHRLRQVLGSENGFGGRFHWVAPVGTISLFPHRYNLRSAAVLIFALGAASLRVYGFASSVSSLTFVTDYAGLDSAVSAIMPHVDLPRGIEPSRPAFRIRQRPSTPDR